MSSSVLFCARSTSKRPEATAAAASFTLSQFPVPASRPVMNSFRWASAYVST